MYHINIRMNSIPVKDSPDMYIQRRTHRNQVLSYSEYRGVTDGSIFIQVYTYSSSRVVVCTSVEDSPDIYIPMRTHQNQVTEDSLEMDT
jgi:hypothetical protein